MTAVVIVGAGNGPIRSNFMMTVPGLRFATTSEEGCPRATSCPEAPS